MSQINRIFFERSTLKNIEKYIALTRSIDAIKIITIINRLQNFV